MNITLHKKIYAILGVFEGLTIAAIALLPLYGVAAADSTYTITYVNGSTTYTKTYDAGSTVTLDALPSGAIAWTNDADPAVPGGKMAYVNYSHTETVNGTQTPINIPMTLTLNGNITLNANYGSYANGQQGPRLIQYHLELKFFDATNNVMMQYEQHYNSVNAPSGYYVALPPANYFGSTLYAQVGATGGLIDTGQTVVNWVNDSSYTGTTTPATTSIFAPNQLVYVDPNNYNMVYDVMVDTSYNSNFTNNNLPPTPTSPPTGGNDTVTFRISQANIPSATLCKDYDGQAGWGPLCGGTFMVPWDYAHSSNSFLVGTTYLEYYNGQAQMTYSNLSDSSAWDSFIYDAGGGMFALPIAVQYPGYTYQWFMDGTAIPPACTPLSADPDPECFDTSIGDYLNSVGTSPTDPIGGSHVFTLQYTPIPATIQLYVDGHTDSVVYDGASHSVSGYDVYDCSAASVINQGSLSTTPGCVFERTSNNGEPVTLANGDILNFANPPTNSNVTATGTDVGTYPIVLTASDFSVTNTSGDLYNLTTSNGGLTITKRPIVIIVDPPIDPNTPGTGNTSVITPGDPNDLAPGQVINTPNGDDTVTSNTGDGDVTYIDPNTGAEIPCDVTKPNCGIILIVDPGNPDPGTGKPADVTPNYDVNNVIPKPAQSGSNTGPGAPNTGFLDSDSGFLRASSGAIVAIIVSLAVVAGYKLRKRHLA